MGLFTSYPLDGFQAVDFASSSGQCAQVKRCFRFSKRVFTFGGVKFLLQFRFTPYVVARRNFAQCLKKRQFADASLLSRGILLPQPNIHRAIHRRWGASDSVPQSRYELRGLVTMGFHVPFSLMSAKTVPTRACS